MSDENNNTNENTSDDAIVLPDELTVLKARADQLGLKYHHASGITKIKKLIDDKLNGPTIQPKVVNIADRVESTATRNGRLRKEANKLVRIRVSCMNPNKKEHEGEIFTVGNSIVGTIKKYVPFNNEEGWHVPQMIYQMMLERQCQIFFTVKAPNGQKVRKGKLIKEFAIEILPALTQVELKELGDRQAIAHNID